MEEFLSFLEQCYTPYHAVALAETFLRAHAFAPLEEGGTQPLAAGGKYFVKRGGSLIAFVLGEGNGCKIVACHDDSPCFKLKENAETETEGYRKLNVEPYGGAVRYTFFDRPLKIAGRTVRARGGKLVSELFESGFSVAIPSLSLHMNRTVNEGFAPDPQIDLSPLLSLGGKPFEELLGGAISYDLFLVSAEKPFVYGANGEFLAAPRLDDLSGVYPAMRAIAGEGTGTRVFAMFAGEEIGSAIYEGADGDLLRATLGRIAAAKDVPLSRLLRASMLFSLDHAQGVHPNRPECSDPTNRPALGGGIVIKSHANGAYTTDALTSAVLKTVLKKASVPFRTFYNRSGAKSGATLGTIVLTQAGIPSVDFGIAQLAMHSAVETIALSDLSALNAALATLMQSEIALDGDTAQVL